MILQFEVTVQCSSEELETGALHLHTVYKVSSHQSENTGSSQENGCFRLLLKITVPCPFQFRVEQNGLDISWQAKGLKRFFLGGNQIRENT